MYGYTFSREGEITGEQDVLRYSAFDCWLKSKESYRKRYYGGMSFKTPETVFGHEGHKRLEQDEEVLPGVPRYEKKEYNIVVPLDKKSGIKIGGQIDTFDPETLSLADYKFSHRSKDGKPPWTAVKVARHNQLVFYSLLVELKHEKVNPFTKLVWIETEWNEGFHEHNGHRFVTGTRELRLTGSFEIFERRIAKWEREKLKKIIRIEAENIKEDFKLYGQKYNAGGLERSREDFSQEESPVEGVLPGDAEEVSRATQA